MKGFEYFAEFQNAFLWGQKQDRYHFKSDFANILAWMLNQDPATAYRNNMELTTLKRLEVHVTLFCTWN